LNRKKAYLFILLFISALCIGCSNAEHSNSGEIHISDPVQSIDESKTAEPSEEAPSSPSGNIDNAPEQAPTLDISLVAEGFPEQHIQAIQLTTEWHLHFDDDTGYSYMTDSCHALQMLPDDFSESSFIADYTNYTITLNFSDNYLPETIAVQRWYAEYARGINNDVSVLSENGESVEVDENSIYIRDDGHDYIYEVYARWQNGSSYYTFRVISDAASALSISVYSEDGRALIFDPPVELLYSGNGNPIVLVEEGCLMLPISSIAEQFGAHAEWQSPYMTITHDGTQYILEAGSANVTVRSGRVESTIALPRAAHIKHDIMYVSLQFFTEIMGIEVTYSGLDYSSDSPIELSRGIVLGELIHDDFSYFNNLHWIVSRPEMTEEEETEIMTAFEEYFQEWNFYDYNEISEIFLNHMRNPVMEAVNHMLGLIYNGNYPNEFDVRWESIFDELYSMYFSLETISSPGWNDFMSLAKAANYDIDLVFLNTSSVENMIISTVFCYLNDKIGILPLLFEAELSMQDDGGWLITDISNPRSYVNMQSLAAIESEVFDQLQLWYNYRTWSYAKSPY